MTQVCFRGLELFSLLVPKPPGASSHRKVGDKEGKIAGSWVYFLESEKQRVEAGVKTEITSGTNMRLGRGFRGG